MQRASCIIGRGDALPGSRTRDARVVGERYYRYTLLQPVLRLL